MTPSELEHKKVLIAGLGVSGASAVRYLQRLHIDFDVADERGATELQLPVGSTLHSSLDVASGYDVIVLSPGIPRAHAAIEHAGKCGATIINDVELFASVVREPVIAVTGSNGKSTVVAWLAHALAASGVEAIACGNIGTPVLDALQDTAAVYVLELSSYQLESLTRLTPLAAAVLNISEDHLDRYASLDDYAGVKRRIYDGARCRVVNLLDERTLPEEPLTAVDAVVLAGSAPQAGVGVGSASPVCWHFSGNADRAAANDPMLCREHEPVLDAQDLSVPGIHNAANALTVLALAECLTLESSIEMDQEQFRQALMTWPGLPHRTTLIAEHGGVRWYDDSKGTNVDACIKAIEAMSGAVILIAGGIGKDADFSVLAPVVRRHVKQAILLGRDRAVLQQALEGATRLSMADTLPEAVAQADAASTAGDAVLLSPACASFDMFDNYMARGLAFQDAVHAQVGSR